MRDRKLFKIKIPDRSSRFSSTWKALQSERLLFFFGLFYFASPTVDHQRPCCVDGDDERTQSCPLIRTNLLWASAPYKYIFVCNELKSSLIQLLSGALQQDMRTEGEKKMRKSRFSTLMVCSLPSTVPYLPSLKW